MKSTSKRMIALAILFSMVLSIIPQGFAAELGVEGGFYCNSDVEVYANDGYYVIHEEDGNRLYQESGDGATINCLSEMSFDQVATDDNLLYVMHDRAGKAIISTMDFSGNLSEDIVVIDGKILRFAVTEDTLYYLTDETLFSYEMGTEIINELVRVAGLSRFWLEEEKTVHYIAGDDSIIYCYDVVTGETTSYSNVATDLVTDMPNQLVPARTRAATATVSGLQSKFPHGKYWNHSGGGSGNNNPDGYTSTPCGSCHGRGTCPNQPSDCYCNKFNGGVQCFGFAYKLAYDYFGSYASSWSSGSLSSLKAGDVIRYKNNGHSIWVTAVNGDTITYADCNSSGTCNIRWNQTISKSTVQATLSWIKSAPYSISAESCSCSSSYAGNYTCTTSTANLTIRSGHGSSYSSIGSIPPGATVYVSKASGTSTSDWAHVEYNGLSGYASMEYLKKQSAEVDLKLSYWLSYDKMGDKITTAKQGEWVYLCYRIYDANSGKNLNEVASRTYTVTETILNPDGSTEHTYTYSNSDNNWIGARLKYAGTYTYKVAVAGELSGTYSKTITIDANPKQIHSSTNTVNLTLGGTESTTIYAWTSGYHNNSTVLSWQRSNSNISCEWGEWNDENLLPLTITANAEGSTVLTLSVKDKDSGTVLDTFVVNVIVGVKTYTVAYNANGGSGAPSSQTKKHAAALSLSGTLPVRFGYTFLGWNTSSSATVASYKPGDSFTQNSNTTLYAVWQSAATISSGVTSSSYSASVSFAHGYKYYSFTPSTSGTYRFESTGDLDTQIYVYDANGNQISSNDDGGDANNFLLSYQFTGGTKYYIKVNMYGSATGSVSFTVKRMYDIIYNANGGSGAPNSQTKTHGITLTLSSTKPTRSGYTFLGWSTSSTATSATHQAGGTFTANANTTLYAVWKEDGHSYSYKATKNPTTSATGTLTGTCSKCSGTTTVTLPKLTTTDYNYKVVTATTCTANGTGRYTWKTTTYGNFYFDVTINKPGHNYTYKTTKAPTTSAAGTLTGTCSKCSGTTTVSLPKLTTTDYNYVVTKAAACTTDGTGRYTWKTTTYGTFNFDVTINKLGHSYTTKVTAPTCTAQGYTTHTCVCGDSYVDTYVDALGHTFTKYNSDGNATCTEDGTKTAKCDRCNVTKTVADADSAKGHTFGAWTQTKAASCTVKGAERRDCAHCDAYETHEIDELGHDYSAIVTAATCTEQGYTTHICSRCDDTYVDSYETATGHAWDNGTVTMEPAETQNGIMAYRCTRCTEIKTELIPALGEADKTCDGGTNCPSKQFTDVGGPQTWYHEGVDFAVAGGLFNGMTETTFEPDTAMSRAMLVTVLWRYSGSVEEGENTFADVADNSWYAKAVAWAAHNGIVNGVDADHFAPDDLITREQMATILFRYCNQLELDTSARADLTAYADHEKVGDYAKDALRWAVAEGLINGIDGQLAARGNATRAQVATILMRFIRNVVDK